MNDINDLIAEKEMLQSKLKQVERKLDDAIAKKTMLEYGLFVGCRVVHKREIYVVDRIVHKRDKPHVLGHKENGKEKNLRDEWVVCE